MPDDVLKRRHGLGDIVMLLPVLWRMAQDGGRMTVLTRGEWAEVFAQLAPYAEWTDEALHWTLDLDDLTARASCERHRTDELAWLLGVPRGDLTLPTLMLPDDWSPLRYDMRERGYCVFAPGAEHAARRPSDEWVSRTWLQMPFSAWSVAVGMDTDPPLPLAGEYDRRGKTSLRELLGILAGARVVITMDSGIMHLAAALGRPTVAVFGGVDPRLRLRDSQRVVALVSSRDCRPCNKRETCGGEYPCLADVTPGDVGLAVGLAPRVSGLTIVEVTPCG